MLSASFAASAVVSAAVVYAAAVVSVLEDVETLHAVRDMHIIAAAMPSAIIFFIVVLSSFLVFASAIKFITPC